MLFRPHHNPSVDILPLKCFFFFCLLPHNSATPTIMCLLYMKSTLQVSGLALQEEKIGSRRWLDLRLELHHGFLLALSSCCLFLLPLPCLLPP